MKTPALFLISIVMAMANTNASADASGKIVDVYDQNQTLLYQTVTVSIEPNPADVGRPGAYYIGVSINGGFNKRMAYFANGQWYGIDRTGYHPSETFAAVPGGYRNYVVLDKKLICDVMGNGHIDLYAGYGVLNDRAIQTVENYSQVARPGAMSPEQVRDVNIRNDMMKNNKYWDVLQYDCNQSNSG